jgi:hypothetical protein
VLAHGGAESLYLRGLTQARWKILDPTRDPPANPIRRLEARVARRFSPHCTFVDWREFVAAYDRVLELLLRQGHRRVLVVEPCGGDPTVTRFDTEFLELLTKHTEQSSVDPNKVRFLRPQLSVRRWDDFAADRAHLRTSARYDLGQSIGEVLRDMLEHRPMEDTP